MKKKVFLIASLFSFLVLVVIGARYVPAMKTYFSAEKAYSQGEYLDAIDKYSALGDFRDSEEMILKSYYALGTKMMPDTYEGDLALQAYRAAKMFANSKNYDDAKVQIFNCGMNLLKYEEYRYASSTFALLDDIKSESYSKFAKGLEEFEKGWYEEAKASFKEVKKLTTDKLSFETVDAQEISVDYMINILTLMEAEEYFSGGELSKAQSKYKLLPLDFSYDGISVSERLATLEEHGVLVELCGKWICTLDSYDKDRGEIKIRQIPKSGNESTKGWRRDAAPNTNDRFLTVKCFLSDSEYCAAFLECSATMEFYYKWEDVASNLKESTLTLEFTIPLTSDELETLHEAGFKTKRVWIDSFIGHGTYELFPDLDRDRFIECSYDENAFHVFYSFVEKNYHIDYDYEQSSMFIYNKKISP